MDAADVVVGSINGQLTSHGIMLFAVITGTIQFLSVVWSIRKHYVDRAVANPVSVSVISFTGLTVLISLTVYVFGRLITYGSLSQNVIEPELYRWPLIGWMAQMVSSRSLELRLLTCLTIGISVAGALMVYLIRDGNDDLILSVGFALYVIGVLALVPFVLWWSGGEEEWEAFIRSGSLALYVLGIVTGMAVMWSRRWSIFWAPRGRRGALGRLLRRIGSDP